MPRISAFSELFALVLACSSCASASGPWVALGGHRYSVEVATTEAERARGLMFRDELPAGHGMLFIHEEEGPLAYWMKNTRIPLDIVFLDKDMRVVEVEHAKPLDESNVGPDSPTQYVIELNAGAADKLGLKTGDKIEIPKKYQKN